MRLFCLRLRDSGFPEPPPQTRMRSFPVSGSSVVLAVARTFTVARYKAQLLLPSVRLARVHPILHVRHEFPVWAAYFRRVLHHVAGFPNLRLLCPIRHPVGIRRTPDYLVAPCSMTAPERTPLQGSSPSCVPGRSVSSFSLHPGAFGASPSSPTSLFARMARVSNNQFAAAPRPEEPGRQQPGQPGFPGGPESLGPHGCAGIQACRLSIPSDSDR